MRHNSKPVMENAAARLYMSNSRLRRLFCDAYLSLSLFAAEPVVVTSEHELMETEVPEAESALAATKRS